MNFKRIFPILILLTLLIGSSVVFATETTQSIDDITDDSLSIEEDFELDGSDTGEFEDVFEYNLDDDSGDWDLDDDEFDDDSGDWDLDDDEFDDDSGDWDLEDADLYYEEFYSSHLNSSRLYIKYFTAQHETNESSCESGENDTEDDLDEVYAICIKYSSPISFSSNILGNHKSDNDNYQNIKSYVKNFNEKHLHEINSIITPTNKTGGNGGNETIGFTHGFNNLFSLIAILFIGIIMIL